MHSTYLCSLSLISSEIRHIFTLLYVQLLKMWTQNENLAVQKLLNHNSNNASLFKYTIWQKTEIV